MTIPTTIPTTSTTTLNTTSSSSTSSAAGSVNSDYMSFLNMLTTELQNQDPTAPVDSTSFTQQLIGFSQLQEQNTTNTDLSSLIGQGSSSNVTSAVSYINQFVKAQSTQFNIANNVGYVSYNLPSSAASVTVSVTNSSGQVLNTFSGATTSGMHDYSFNGVDSNGNTLPDGTYSFNVTATDAEGNAITSIPTYTTGVVTSVDLENGATTLHMGNTTDDLAFTTDEVASIEGEYASTPTVANPTTTQSVTSAATNAVSSVASAVADAL